MNIGDWRFNVDNGAGGWNQIVFNSFRFIRRARGIHTLSLLLPFKNSFGVKQISLLSGNLEVQLQRYDGTNWVTWFGGKTNSAGKIKQNGSIELDCRGEEANALEEEINPSFASNLSNVDVMTVIWSGASGFSVQDPASIGPVTTFTINKYKLNDSRKKGVSELSSNYRWTTYVDYDSSNYAPGAFSHVVRYEPTGFVASGEIIDSSSDRVIVLEWEKDRFLDQFGKVMVIGVNSSGDEITATAGSGAPFVRRNIGYVENVTDAQDIANQLAGTGSGDGGKIRVPWFLTSIVNETITLIDSQRDINGTFVVKRQINLYPEGVSELELGFSEEDDGVGQLSEREAELREERASLFKSANTNVGGQNAGTLTTGSAESDTAITGSISKSAIDVDFNTNKTRGTPAIGGGQLSVSVRAPTVSGNGDINIIHCHVGVENISSSENGWDLIVNNTSTASTLFFIENFIPGDSISGNNSVSFIFSGDIEGDNIQLIVENYSDAASNVDASISVSTIAQHSHGDNFDTSDAPHGGSGDSSTHGVSGSTANKNVSLLQKSNKDR